MDHLERTRQRFIVLAAILAVSVLALLGYLFWPGSSSSAQQSEKARLQQKLNDLKRDVALWQTSNPEKTRADLKLLYTQDIPGRWSQVSERIEKLQKEAGITTPANIRYGNGSDNNNEKTELPDVQRIKVEMTVTGDYAKVARFINAMEQDPMLFVIEKISLSNQAEGGTISLQVTFDTFLKAA